MNKIFKRVGIVLGVVSASALPFLAGAQTFDVPTSTASSLTANVTSQISQPGVLNLIILAVGVPLFFYIVHQAMGLLPGRRARKA
jgi:hypothetical protein